MLLDEINKISEKIEQLADSEDLEFQFSTGQFPITCVFTRKPNNQMSMIEHELIAGGQLVFIFDEEMQVAIKDDFKINDDKLNALKNSCKKLHYTFLQIYFKNNKEKENLND